MNEQPAPRREPNCFRGAADEAVASRVAALLAIRPRVIVAVDGNCCSGKTTAANRLAGLLDADVFHMDDFFLRPEMRTEARLRTPGGNVDAERFLLEVLEPLSKGGPVTFRRYDCRSGAYSPPVSVRPRAVSIVEGAYCLHPLLAPYYDLKVFYRVGPAAQAERIRARNGEAALERFLGLWVPLENAYFSALNVERSCDIAVDTTDG